MRLLVTATLTPPMVNSAMGPRSMSRPPETAPVVRILPSRRRLTRNVPLRGLTPSGPERPEGVKPLNGTFRVSRLREGRIRTTGAVSGGRDIDLGPMALLTIGGVSVAVTSKRMQALDQAPFRHLGVEPKDQRILVLKS